MNDGLSHRPPEQGGIQILSDSGHTAGAAG